MHGTQAGDMWTARLLVCYLHCVYATSVNISTDTKDIFINEKENNWWDARETCKMAPERDLYISDTEFLPPVVENSLHSKTSYWVGAMRYSTWIWTEDDSPLYNYDGYTTTLGSSPKSLSNNSVYECQLQCKTNRKLGLSGTSCYCLDNSYEVPNISAAGEMQCPGNLDDKCGNHAGMSVYTRGTGTIGFNPTRNRICAYYGKKGGRSAIQLDFSNNCIVKQRRFAYYANNTLQKNCPRSMCVSLHKQSWIQADHTSDLIKLNTSTASDILGETNFWIGLVSNISRKWVDGQEANGYDDYFPFIVSPITTCLALINTRDIWRPHWVPCGFPLASICEVSRADPYHPTTDVPPAVDSQKGVTIGLSVSNVIFLLIVIAVVFLLLRQRKLHLPRKDTNQQMIFNTSKENMTYGLDVPTDNGAYSVITPDTIDGKPFTPPVPTVTVNPNTHTKKAFANSPETDVVNENALSMASKQHTDMPRGKPHMHLSGLDYDTAECIQQYRSGDGGYTGLDKSAGGTGVAISEGVQYQFEKRSSKERDKSDAGLYEPTEAAEGNYDTTQQGGKARNVDDSYSHIGAIGKGFEEGAYDVASAGPDVIRLDDTYNHTYETTCKAMD